MTKESTTPFYDRSEADRVAITMAAIDERRTILERWEVLAEPEAAHWSTRAAMAAEWFGDEVAVADLGCGTMNLERYLRADQAYIPVDIVARDDRTIVCDFNREAPSPTAARSVACLGLLEYLHSPHDFMRVLKQQYKLAVVSYCVSDAPETAQNRREHGWVNDFDTAAVEALFQATCWTSIDCRWVDNMQRLWRLSSV